MLLIATRMRMLSICMRRVMRMPAISIAKTVVRPAQRAETRSSGAAATQAPSGTTKWNSAKLAGKQTQPISATKRQSRGISGTEAAAMVVPGSAVTLFP